MFKPLNFFIHSFIHSFIIIIIIIIMSDFFLIIFLGVNDTSFYITCGSEKSRFFVVAVAPYLLGTLGVAVFFGSSTAWMFGSTPP